MSPVETGDETDVLPWEKTGAALSRSAATEAKK